MVTFDIKLAEFVPILPLMWGYLSSYIFYSAVRCRNYLYTDNDYFFASSSVAIIFWFLLFLYSFILLSSFR